MVSLYNYEMLIEVEVSGTTVQDLRLNIWLLRGRGAPTLELETRPNFWPTVSVEKLP